MKLHYAVSLLLLALLSSVGAAELKVSGQLLEDGVTVTLQNHADYEVSFGLKFQLKQKQGSWKLVEELTCGVNDSLEALESRDYNCDFVVPNSTGEYKVFAKANIVDSTYTYKNFEFSVGEEGFEEPEPDSDVILTFLHSPEKVKTGEEFFVVVNVTAYKDIYLDIYSYVYDGKTCKSFWGWKGNSQKWDFSKGQTKTINLTDSVAHETENGSYRLKVRARADKDYDIIRSIEVEQVEADLFKDLDTLPKQDPGLETEDGLPINLMLPLLAGIPILLLLAKKMI
jgi:hypothetical protein